MGPNFSPLGCIESFVSLRRSFTIFGFRLDYSRCDAMDSGDLLVCFFSSSVLPSSILADLVQGIVVELREGCSLPVRLASYRSVNFVLELTLSCEPAAGSDVQSSISDSSVYTCSKSQSFVTPLPPSILERVTFDGNEFEVLKLITSKGTSTADLTPPSPRISSPRTQSPPILDNQNKPYDYDKVDFSECLLFSYLQDPRVLLSLRSFVAFFSKSRDLEVDGKSYITLKFFFSSIGGLRRLEDEDLIDLYFRYGVSQGLSRPQIECDLDREERRLRTKYLSSHPLPDACYAPASPGCCFIL